MTEIESLTKAWCDHGTGGTSSEFWPKPAPIAAEGELNEEEQQLREAWVGRPGDSF